MLRNNVYWDRGAKGEWNYATNKANIDEYWRWAAEHYGGCEAQWTLGIRGTHDEPMKGAGDASSKVALMESVIAVQTNMLAKYVAPRHDAGGLQQPVGQGGLAVVDVGDDAEIADSALIVIQNANASVTDLSNYIIPCSC